MNRRTWMLVKDLLMAIAICGLMLGYCSVPESKGAGAQECENGKTETRR